MARHSHYHKILNSPRSVISKKSSGIRSGKNRKEKCRGEEGKKAAAVIRRAVEVLRNFTLGVVNPTRFIFGEFKMRHLDGPYKLYYIYIL